MTDQVPDAELRQLMDAGSSALRFNAPLSDERAARLIATIGGWGPKHVVDFGCGRGELANSIASSISAARVVGVDSVGDFIAHADSNSVATFDLADASKWTGPCDVAISIGSSHAFGGLGKTLDRFATLDCAHAIIGDGFWAAEPDDWCLEVFGDELDGLDAVRLEAETRGWSIVELDASTLEEWDAFEGGWRAGVRSVGTEAAESFADQREAEYARYRGVLGFAWLLVTKSAP